MSETDLVMYAGDDRSFLLTITGLADVTGAEARFTAKRRLSDSDDEAIIALTTGGGEVEVVDATHIRVDVPRAATVALTRELRLVWDLKVALGGEVRTLPDPEFSRVSLGRLIVRRPVAITAP